MIGKNAGKTEVFYLSSYSPKLSSNQLLSAGLIARDNRLKGELRYMFQSLCAWPSPFWQPRRFAAFAVSAINSFRRRKEVYGRS